MSGSENNSYEAFSKANAPKPVTEIDYVCSMYQALNLPRDFVLSFARLIWPSFILVDGKIFVRDLFDKERYDGLLRDGHSVSAAQFWTNLLEVTGLFGDMPEAQAMEFAEILATSWNRKLESEFDEAQGRARTIHDAATGEVFVVIGRDDSKRAKE